MRHKVTTRTEQAMADLRRMAAALRPDLSLASSAARLEWTALQAQWPSAAELAGGTIGLSPDELDQMLAKVRRFAEILAAIKHSLRDRARRPARLTPAPALELI